MVAGGFNSDSRAMDFAIFHLDGLGNRALIASIAILHVLINHAFAVGALPLIAYLEHLGIKTGDERWDRLARQLLAVTFFFTTTVGAMTGVGIWFSSSLVNPYSIGSLLRIFFWGWFAEWLVFITEVCLIMAYYLTWDSWRAERKRAHQNLGRFLAVFSWITMALIVAVLSFMMTSGEWHEHRSFWVAFLNPLYLPQLGFRTFLALTSGGLLAMTLIPWFTDGRDNSLRRPAMRLCASWVLTALIPLGLCALWYWKTVPQAMTGNLAVALTTMEFTSWHRHLLLGATSAIGLVVSYCLATLLRPVSPLSKWALVPLLLTLALLGLFERVREFIRKPYVIPQYMYSNTYRLEDYPLLQKDGVLKHAAFSPITRIEPGNQVEAGRQVFLLTCSRCHTTGGVNGLTAKFKKLLGSEPWAQEPVANYISNMHGARPFMPPFPGNPEELKALSAYIVQLQSHPESGLGAQNFGIFATKEAP